VTVDVSEGDDDRDWAPLPTHDRVLTGGRTVYLGVPDPPLLVTQPSRWGVVEESFPDVACLVECDPLVTAALPLPARVEGWVDRCHRPVEPPGRPRRAEELMGRAARFAGTLTQIRGVRVAATPFGRTIPILVQVEVGGLVAAAAREGVTGLRPLPGLGGGVALSVHPDHDEDALGRVRDVLAALLRRVAP
jgi:hypothetical protein